MTPYEDHVNKYALHHFPLRDIILERVRQDAAWEDRAQELPYGTGEPYRLALEQAKCDAQGADKRGELTWAHLLCTEFFDALAQRDPKSLRRELVHLAAVAVAWIEQIDRKYP